MRYIKPVILLGLAAALQGNLPESIEIFGAMPDLILVVLITYALAEDPVFGATLGFIAGLLEGSVVGISVGSFIVTRTITGFLAGLVTSRVFSDNPFVPMFSAAWLTVVCEGLFLLFSPRVDIFHSLRAILGEAIHNALFTLVFYYLLRHFETRRKIRLANARI